MADSSDLIRWFRLDMDDLEEPPLWSDEEILEYANDAQQWLCRKTEGIEDSMTPSVCTINVAPTPDASASWVPLSPLILKIRGATRNDTGRGIPVVNPEKLEAYGIRWDGNSSVVKALVVGLTKNKARVYPVSSESVVITLSVFRLPLVDIIEPEQALEVDSQHHRALVLWMRHRGYSKQDADTLDLKRAADYEAKFDAYCYKALQEQERARRSVGVTLYGGI